MLLLSSSLSQADTLRLATHHLPPYQVVNGDALSGSMIDLMQCSLIEMGQAYQVEVRPINRAIKELQAGKFDGVFVLNRTAERDSFATASEPLIVTYRSLFSVKTIDAELHSPAMKELQIGVLHGSAMHRWLTKHDYPNVLTRYDYHILFELMQLERIDAIVAPFEIYENEKSHGQVTRKIETRHLSQANLSGYFSPSWLDKHPDFLPRFNAALAVCK
ncbi:transporter substrate-binding domain-containing protein [Agarivorans aestuarii]|uniref:Transporter substrate-binding domain-containing protein n=1 Tax=Agarivorans aestuarii TaxID=1563703 RepID=A0ABU7G664_9ALTE|nr:transporter substrate-binding domain-containing protein [Agarivorans aestuarii]MEE1674741.1 transporter substrate-binding domain-containing protein [Agarivorans aestuarii]